MFSLGTTTLAATANVHVEHAWALVLGKAILGNLLALPQSTAYQLCILVGIPRRLSLSIARRYCVAYASPHLTLYHHHLPSPFRLLTADHSRFLSHIASI